MPNLDLAFQFENGLIFSETSVAIFSSTEDPTTGASASVGSLFLRSSGDAYLKTGVLDTDWTRVLKNGEVIISAVQPLSGLTVTGSPINNSGTLTFALANDLAAVESLSSAGIAVRTGADSWAVRTIAGAADQIDVANGDGIAGDPSLSLAAVGTAGTYGSASQVPVFTTDAYGRVTGVTNTEISLSLDNLSDVIVTDPSTSQVLAYNGSAWVNTTLTTGGTVTSVAATAPVAGLTISGSPITTSGTLVFALANDLAAVEGLTGTGIAVRTGADSWANRTITAGTGISVTNGSGAAGNPVVAIAANPILPGTEKVTLAGGATDSRPLAPVNGDVRYNSTLNKYEGWHNGTWKQFAASEFPTILRTTVGTIPATSGTTTVPWDNTPPTITEGSQIWTTTISPLLATSKFLISMSFTCDLDSNNRMLIVSIFRNNINIGSASYYSTGGGRPNTLAISITDEPGTTSPVVYSMRAGVGNGAATWYINSTSAGNNLGSAYESDFTFLELA